MEIKDWDNKYTVVIIANVCYVIIFYLIMRTFI